MENINLVLSIIASLLSMISAASSYIFYKKTLNISTKINNSNSNIKQVSKDNSTQIIGNKNKVK